VRIPFYEHWMDVELLGQPGIVVDWRPATDRELSALDWGNDQSIVIAPLADDEVVLAWIGTVCDVKPSLLIQEATLYVAPVPRKGCDLVGVPRGLALTYAKGVDPNVVDVRLGDRVLLPG
jgi:hypothetical protein